MTLTGLKREVACWSPGLDCACNHSTALDLNHFFSTGETLRLYTLFSDLIYPNRIHCGARVVTDENSRTPERNVDTSSCPSDIVEGKAASEAVK